MCTRKIDLPWVAGYLANSELNFWIFLQVSVEVGKILVTLNSIDTLHFMLLSLY